MKRRLFRIFAALVVVFAALAGATLFVANSDAGARWVLARIDAAAGGNLSWAAAEGTLMSGMRMADVAYDDGTSLLRIGRVEFAWQPWRLLDGSLVLDRIDIAGLRYQSREASGGEPLTEAALREMLFTLPVAIELRELRADDLALMRPDGSTTRLEIVTGAAALDGDALVLDDLDLRQGEARLRGELRLTRALALGGAIDWQLATTERTYAGMLDLGGTLRQPELVHELTQPLRLVSSGTLNSGMFAGDALRFDLQHELPPQALAMFERPDLQVQLNARTAGTPEQVDIDGSVQGQVPALAPLGLDFALQYRDAALAIENATLTSTQIALNGSGVLELEPLALRFDWMLDALDPGSQLPQLQLEGVSGTGSVQLAASGDAIAGSLQVGVLNGTLNGYPLAISGMAALAADGGATVDLQAASGTNTLALVGTAADELALEWSVELPEPGALWQGLSGMLTGSGSVNGPRTAPAANGSIDGNLRLASGGDVFALGEVALTATHGANGNDVRLVLGNLTQTSAGATTVVLQRGELVLTGTPAQHALSADLRAPQDALQLRARGAFADGNWTGAIEQAELASRAGDWQLEEAAAIDYTAGTLTVAQNCWGYLQTRLCLQGNMPAGQGLDAEVALSALPLTWLNRGAAAPAAKPAALQQAQDAFALNLPAGVRTEGLLDAEVRLRGFRGAEWDAIDIALQSRAWAVEITQQVAEGSEAQPLVQRFALDVERGEVHAAGNDWSGALDMRIRHEQDGGSQAQGTLRGSGELAADGSVAASAELAFGDLGWIEFVAPVLRAPAGVLNGTVGVSGTREQPQLQANLQLREGSVDVPLYGLAIRDARFDLVTDAGNVLRLDGAARSGDGQLEFRAQLDRPLQETRELSAEISGTDVLAIATDYATVTVSPDLRGSLSADLLTVDGSIEVKDTEVDLEEIFGTGGENAVDVSRDAVIVSGEQGTAMAEQQALRIAANVDVRLGENVHVSGYDLDAMLDGELRIEQRPGRPALVYGELGIPEGRYEIYNQELNARDGRLVFFGNPANPLLDVRAFRDLESGEVGVHLTGNLDSIQGRLYSTPTLPDNEALALLVTGKSLGSVNAEESDALVGAIASFGLGRSEGFQERVGSTLGLDSFTVGGGSSLEDSALGLGKYLTPDLLMRYKLGLFDRQSVLGIEYTLTERLKLEVETGISQSVDLNYTIEKD